MTSFEALTHEHFESLAILRKLASTSRQLAELKGMAASIPDQGILLSTLGLQEAKDSSAIENLVTTHDDFDALQNSPWAALQKSTTRGSDGQVYRQFAHTMSKMHILAV